MEKTKRPIYRRILRGLAWLLGIVVVLLVSLTLVLQTPWAQGKIRNIAVSYLEKKLKTNVEIKGIRINWLYNLELSGVRLDDHQQKTLLYIGELEASYRLLDLLSNQLTIHSVEVDSLYANAYRPVNTDQFNFSFIIDAFADSSAAPADTSSAGSAMRFDIGKVTLNKLNITFNDAFGGQYYMLKGNSIETKISSLDLEKQLYEVDYLESLGLNGVVKFSASRDTSVVEAAATAGSSPLPEVSIRKISLKQTTFIFDDGPGGIKTQTYAGLLRIDRSNLHLGDNRLMVKQVLLHDHHTGVVMGPSAETPAPAVATAADTSAPFRFYVEQLSLARNQFSYTDNNTPASPAGIDFARLLLSDLNTSIEKIGYNGEEYTASIRNMAASERSGLQLKALEGDIVYGDKGISWKNGRLQTNRNQINADLYAKYDSIGQFTSHPQLVSIAAAVSNTSIVLDDMLYFSPELGKNEYVRPLLGKTFKLNTTLKGKLNNLDIPSLTLNEGKTSLNASAKVTGLPDAEKMKIDLRLKQFSSTREGLLSWLPKDLLPDNIQLPETFSLSGKYNGTVSNMRTDLQLNTSSGDISIKGKLENITDQRNARYDMVVSTNTLDLGYLLKNPALGKTTVQVNAKGKGFDPNTANAVFQGNIVSLEANGYAYSKMKLNGSLQNKLLKTALDSEDPNLRTKLTLEYSLDSTRPSLKSNIEAFFVDLKKLGFTQEELTLKGKIDADLASADPDHPEGDITIHEVQFGRNGELYPLDSIHIAATRFADSQRIQVNAPFLQLDLSGKYGLTQLAAQTGDMIQRYLSDRPDTIPFPQNPQQAKLSGVISYPKIAATFVPEWKSMTPMPFDGFINTADATLNFETATRQIRYGSFILDSMRIDLEGNKDSMNYFAGIRRLISSDFPLFKTQVSGGISQNTISWAVSTDDRQEKEQYRLAGSLQTAGTRKILQLQPGIILNGANWSVNPENQVVFEDGGLAGGALELSHQGESITVTTGAGGKPVEMRFNNFPIEALTAIIEKDTTLAEGYLNGSIIVPELKPFSFNADIRIDSLKGLGYPVGQLTAQLNSKEAGIYNINANLGSNGNNVDIDGWYNANDSGSMNFDVKLSPINMRSLQPVMTSFLDSMKGFINGNISLKGTPSNPIIRGNLNTRNASLVYKAYNTFVNMPNESIIFDEQGILLNEFVLADSARNEAVVSGRILTTDYSKFRFNLKLDASNFRAVNERSSPDQWIYGPAAIDAALTVKGDLDLPVIEGQVKVRDDSKLTVIIKEEDPGLEDRKGIIAFVNKNAPLDSTLIRNQVKKDSVEEEKVTGIQLSVNTEITPASSLTIVLDEMNGDFLQVKGTASLNTTIDPSGKISMTGRYEVDEGKYQLSLNQLIKRNFDIVKGGTIIWNGAPTEATLDLSAVYKLNTTAYTLIQDIVSNTNTAAVRQRLPFEVYLNIDGEMLQPEISFKLDMPEQERNAFGGVVYTRLKQINQDPSELNKQVMGLLVLNNFIADNPFSSLESSLSGDLASTARRTAGKIVGQQLNNLLGDVIKGVDLNFDLESQDDYSSGNKNTQTDLNISASKNLFNDRTTVTVGSSIGVEGAQNASNLAGDISIEYKLSRDGRYRVKLYRRNNDDVVIQGQFVETGVSFILFMDYNHFREILQRSRQEKIIRRRDEEDDKQ
ncbi:MAG: translocation/assembly module TamB domain-containing protein [Chitinophagaceae bacterium]